MGKKRKVSNGDQKPKSPPLVSSYNDKIRPILDAVDKLRRLNVTQQGIPLPTIVVVGDQSSGKSSVLESLAGISLPRGQGICTRVPLIMRLQHHLDPVPEFRLQFKEKNVTITEESQIAEAIDLATVEIAGSSKGISNVPLTLVVKKNGVPDLTMIDLPGITRVAVHDQPENIYEQITDIIMEHIKPEESIILNVLSADVDFTTCESIRMSRRVDSTGQRTLAVVTKSDRSPNGLLEKVTTNAVNIGLGYVCVRNRIDNETYNEAQIIEAKLFESHPLLSVIDKSMVGIPVLAQKLVQIQSVTISKCLPDIVKKIKEKLNDSVLELNKLPQNLKSIPEAMIAFTQIIGSLKETLQKFLIRGEFDDLENEHTCCNARLAEMVDDFSKELHTDDKISENFLVEELRVLKEANGIQLPQFLPNYVFLYLLQRKVSSISDLPVRLVNKVWDYLESICVEVLIDHCGSYPQLHSPMRKATQNLMAKMKNKFLKRVFEMIEMEKSTDYTCDPNYIVLWNQLKSKDYDTLSQAVLNRSKVVNLKGHGTVTIDHLFNVPENVREQAFDLKMRMVAYWGIVLKRMVDWLALQLRFMIRKVVNKEMETAILNEVMLPAGGGIEKMLDEPPSVAKNKERLQRSIALLQESKEIIEQVMSDILITAD
ncbi:putative dynamin GTPase [Helianthus annuus]|uniref:Dynamin GTPase n=1 Tax=Helianthus annuus TaxID=4232 RepID=A0A251V8N6_HELAN|nr:dynamin-related protein 4C [Helianthus annuus]KAF5814967.1 putative dynamin GTPase [Helianthus annuus]KAJ0936289.1 putative dynamin GTPase [Helianthus annuus]KAJ0944213.1 putative dynamin GTPase [Helianthus annuus]